MIDDNPGDCELVRSALALRNPFARFYEVPNGVTAFNFLSHRGQYTSAPSPDVIILDLNLPVMEGQKILKVLQSDETWKRIPVVILTSSDRSSDKEMTRLGGARKYLVKPTTWDHYPPLVQCLEEFWQQDLTPPVAGTCL
jgi:two-component system, chemotaxis family, response regulator Rcp1